MNIKTVAFYGAGMLGSGFVKSLRRQGYEVHVWNRSFEKAKALEAVGARAFEDAAQAARGADIVRSACATRSAVDDDSRCGAAGHRHGHADRRSHDRQRRQRRSARAAAERRRDIRFCTRRSSWDRRKRRTRKASCSPSGAQETFDACLEHLSKLTGKVKYFGERADLAAVYKLMGNAMILAVVGGINDVLTIAQTQGLSRTQAYELFSFYSVEGQITGRGKQDGRR